MQLDLDQTLVWLSLSQFEIAAFCQRWQVPELALFGSVLREDFCPDSNVDVLVEFQPTAPKGLTAQEQPGTLLNGGYSCLPCGRLMC